ncbi:MAG TPA: hypothetical protein VIL69_17605 [Roseomonas sp.]|jgi:hypothetical protein
MNSAMKMPILAAVFLSLGGLSADAQQEQATGSAANMTFFVTSVGIGRGADLGGLSGADAHCQSLAQAAGAGARTWHAYLSTAMSVGTPAVDARSRIGRGPWRNARGQTVANSLDDLHGANNNLNKQTALTERGEVVNGVGDTPNMHDILTGSQADGTAFAGNEDMTCGNWTMSGAEGAAMVGHSDRRGLRDDAPSRSWNSSHASRGGCSQAALRSTGSAGLLYCFAID